MYIYISIQSTKKCQVCQQRKQVFLLIGNASNGIKNFCRVYTLRLCLHAVMWHSTFFNISHLSDRKPPKELPTSIPRNNEDKIRGLFQAAPQIKLNWEKNSDVINRNKSNWDLKSAITKLENISSNLFYEINYQQAYHHN